MKKTVLLLFCLCLKSLSAENLYTVIPENSETLLRNQHRSLSINEKKLLDRVYIIIKNPENLIIEKESSGKFLLSGLYISRSLINDPVVNLKTAHYLRNRIVPKKERVYFQGYEEFVMNNSEIICKAIYYFYHKEYYRAYSLYPMECDNLFNDKNIEKELNELCETLKKENSLFLYGMKL